MSTRAQIGFYKNEKQKFSEFEALIYRHSDGYPDSQYGVSTELLPLLKEYHKSWGLDDVQYAAARTLQHLCNTHDQNLHSGSNIDRFRVYGISKDIHNDINFFYAVYGTGLLKVFMVDVDMEKFPHFEHKFTLLHKFDLKK